MRSKRYGLLCGCALAAILAAAVGMDADDPQPYLPRPVALPGNASYILPDGSISIVGSSRLTAVLTGLDALFARTHPGFKFKLVLKESSVIAMQAVSAGVSAFAPMDREIWGDRVEARPFIQAYGHAPADIRFGRVGYAGAGRTNPPGVYVNAGNPLAGLTLGQVARIFTTGNRKGDLSHWGQVGAKGDWAEHAIHLYGARDDGWWLTTLRQTRMDGCPFSRRYEPLSNEADIIQAVAGDLYGMAIAESYDPSVRPRPVRMLPLSEGGEAPYSNGTYAEVAAGSYPLSPYLHLYVNRTPGKPLDPFIREYARLVLSREGQALIEAQGNTPGGYVPLRPDEVARELEKLE